MSCESSGSGGRGLLLAGALLVNLLIFALIPGLFQRAAERRAGVQRCEPPVYVAPVPPETRPQMTAVPVPPRPAKLPPPPPLEPEPLPAPELRPEIHLPGIRLRPRIATRLEFKLSRPAAPAPATLPRSAVPVRTFFRIGELDRQPLGLFRRQPPYPFRARRRGIEGRVKVRFFITPEGRVEGVRIVKAEPPGYFEKSVLHTVANWRFRPGVVAGRPVKTLVETTIVFKLDR